MWLAALGSLGSLVGALWMSTVLANLLFGVTPHGPLTLSIVSAALLSTSLLATSKWAPALLVAPGSWYTKS